MNCTPKVLCLTFGVHFNLTGGFLFMFRFLISMREIYLYWKNQNKRDGWIY